MNFGLGFKDRRIISRDRAKQEKDDSRTTRGSKRVEEPAGWSGSTRGDFVDIRWTGAMLKWAWLNRTVTTQLQVGPHRDDHYSNHDKMTSHLFQLL